MVHTCESGDVSPQGFRPFVLYLESGLLFSPLPTRPHHKRSVFIRSRSPFRFPLNSSLPLLGFSLPTSLSRRFSAAKPRATLAASALPSPSAPGAGWPRTRSASALCSPPRPCRAQPPAGALRRRSWWSGAPPAGRRPPPRRLRYGPRW